jgi:hypothetical protein
MMVLRRIILVLLAALPICDVAFADKSADNMKVEDVMHLKPEKAEVDARQALAHGDTRLLAVYGYTVEVPGVRANAGELKVKYGLRMLEGTTDSYKNDRDRQMNENARRYASIYNRIVVSQSSK